MKTRELLKRTPFRLAAAFTGLFLITATILSVFLYVRLGAELAGQIRIRVDETLEELVAVDAGKGFEELAAIVDNEVDSARHADTIFLLIDKQGHVIAGNVDGLSVATGPLTLPRSSLKGVADQGNPEDQFFVKWGRVTGGHLLVGASDHEIRSTRRILLRGLAWGLAATLVLAALCGTFLARRAQNRINAIATTLESVSQGQLDARVPISGSKDDIDHVGEQVNRTLGHLKTLVENVNQASSDIAHDLKKPIGRVHQNLEEVRRTAKQPAEFQLAIDGSLRELNSIVETFEALLNIAQIEAGARKARFETVDLGQIVADIKDVYEAVAEDHGDSLGAAIEVMHPACIRGDKELLTQVLANLIENAIQHCPQGTKITIGLTEAPGGYAISIADNGAGIPKGERKKVLRRFYRLERARSTPGNGLGLSLVAAITELHDATLSLEDNFPGLKAVITAPKA